MHKLYSHTKEIWNVVISLGVPVVVAEDRKLQVGCALQSIFAPAVAATAPGELARNANSWAPAADLLNLISRGGVQQLCFNKCSKYFVTLRTKTQQSEPLPPCWLVNAVDAAEPAFLIPGC